MIADAGAEEPRWPEYAVAEVVHSHEALLDRVHEPVASYAADMMGRLVRVEADAAYADTDAIVVRTVEHIEGRGRPCEDGNNLGMKAATSCLAALVSRIRHVVSEAEPCVLDYMAACLMDVVGS